MSIGGTSGTGFPYSFGTIENFVKNIDNDSMKGIENTRATCAPCANDSKPI